MNAILAGGPIEGFFRLIVLVLAVYALACYPKDVYKYIKFLKGRNDGYKLNDFVLLVFATAVVSFILEIVVHVSFFSEYRPSIPLLCAIACILPIFMIILYINKYRQLH